MPENVNWIIGKGGKNFDAHDWKYLDSHKWTIGSIGVKDISHKSSEGNKEHILGNWRKGEKGDNFIS